MPKAAVKKRAAPPKVAAIKFPAERVVRLKLSDVKPYARNPRTHSNAQVQQLAKAIERFGFVDPIVVDSRLEIIAGHGRALAAMRLRMNEVPAIVIADGEWSKADIKAFRIWDNQSTLLSEWSPEFLKLELGDLKLMEFPLELTGFGDVQLISFMSGVPDGNEWTGMPGFAPMGNERPDWYQSVMFHFKTKEDVDSFSKKAGVKITEDTKMVEIPKPIKPNHMSKNYASERQ